MLREPKILSKGAEMASGMTTLGTALRQVEQLFEGGSGTVAGLDDASLWERFAAQGDEVAFEALVVRYGPMVLGSARAIVGDYHSAEDVFQATFVALARRSRSIRRAEALAGWLHRVACREAIRTRAQIRRRVVRERRVTPQTDTLTRFDRDEVCAAVHAEVNRLPDAYRIPIILCDLEGWTKASAADHLGWTEGEVRGRLERGRARLKVRLTRQGFGSAIGTTASFLTWSASEASAAALGATRGFALGKLAPRLVASTVRAAIGESVALVGPTSTVGKLGSSVPALALKSHWIRGGLVALGLAGSVGVASSMVWNWSTLVDPAGGADGIEASRSEPPRPPVGNTPPPEPAPLLTNLPADPEQPGDWLEVGGRVLDPKRQPVPGALVRFRFPNGPSATDVESTMMTDASGRFSTKLARPRIDLGWGDEITATASAPGLGMGYWTTSNHQVPNLQEMTIRLTLDDVPIEGRVVDREGKPVAGALVRVNGVDVPRSRDLTDWAELVERYGTKGVQDGVGGSQLIALGPFAALNTLTDAEGRYRLVGLGRERVVELLVSAQRYSTTEVLATTQDRGPIVSTPWGSDAPSMTFATARVETVLQPGRTLTGQIRDAETGQTIPGISLQGQIFRIIGGDIPWPGVETLSELDRPYRLEGLPEADRHWLFVRPGRGQPYPNSDIATPSWNKSIQGLRTFQEMSARRAGRQQVDVTLRRGVMLRGRVTNKETGEPIANASVTAYALVANPEVARYPGMGRGPLSVARTDADGKYEVVALPGRGLLTVAAHQSMKVVQDFEGIDGYDPEIKGFATVFPVADLAYCNAVVPIEPVAGTSPTVEITVDPGRKVVGTILDPEGEVLIGTSPMGLHPNVWLAIENKTGSFEALGLDPKHPRRVFFFHRKRKLAGSIVIRGDEAGPVAVRLGPWSSVTGRLVGEDGKPLAGGLTVSTTLGNDQRRLDRGFMDFTDVMVEKDGSFRLDGLIPGLLYQAVPARGHDFGEPLFENLTVEAGETKPLGDLAVKRFGSP